MTLTPSSTPQVTGDPTELACHVTNITHFLAGGRLGVAWEYTPLPGPPGDRLTTTQTTLPIGSLDAHGNLKSGTLYRDRLESGAIVLTRVEPDTFKLRFLRTQVGVCVYLKHNHLLDRQVCIKARAANKVCVCVCVPSGRGHGGVCVQCDSVDSL